MVYKFADILYLDTYIYICGLSASDCLGPKLGDSALVGMLKYTVSVIC